MSVHRVTWAEVRATIERGIGRSLSPVIKIPTREPAQHLRGMTRKEILAAARAWDEATEAVGECCGCRPRSNPYRGETP